MNSKLIFSLLFIVSICVFMACGGGNKGNTGEKAVLKFEQNQFNFGTTINGDTVRHVYKFKNEGKVPLIIKEATVACDCTVPTWPKEAIAPGAESEIKVEFRSKDKVGTIRKEIKVVANTEPESQPIYLIGEVVDKK